MASFRVSTFMVSVCAMIAARLACDTIRTDSSGPFENMSVVLTDTICGDLDLHKNFVPKLPVYYFCIINSSRLFENIIDYKRLTKELVLLTLE